MPDFDKPIETLEDARVYFQTMGCSDFHMGREYPERYREYRRLGVSKDQERAWREESLAHLAAQASSPDTDPGDLWLIHSRMEDLVSMLRTRSALEYIHEITVQIADRLPARGKMIVAETINGRQYLEYRPGLIFLAHDLGRKDLSASFTNLAIRCSKCARRRLESESKRCRQALLKTRKIRRLLWMESWKGLIRGVSLV